MSSFSFTTKSKTICRPLVSLFLRSSQNSQLSVCGKVHVQLAGKTRLSSLGFTHPFHHMCSKPDFIRPTILFKTCTCGCSAHHVHTKGDKELVDFLVEEITVEKKNRKMGKLPTRLDGFDIRLAQSEISLEKKLNDETVTITLNVNHSVDADQSQAMAEPTEGEAVDMKSQPNFKVDLKKGNKTLSFSCSFSLDEESEPGTQDAYSDAFNIDEVVIYEDEFSDKTYAVSGDILDGVLYDLYMNLLQERGVSNEFADKLSEFSSAYEHNCYIAMLEGVRSFIGAQ